MQTMCLQYGHFLVIPEFKSEVRHFLFQVAKEHVNKS
jgi:hypothetical protein